MVCPFIIAFPIVDMRLLAVFLVLSSTIVSGECLVIDHRHTNASMIPVYWIERAKELTVHYAHTSHGSQIISGLNALGESDQQYRVAVREADTAGLPEVDDTPALRIYDGNPPETYVMPEGYWASPEGLESTERVARTGEYDLSMWSWCGQQSENDAATVNRYLATLDSLEKQHNRMRFIYMTGHTDGGSATLERNNQLIRDYCQRNGKVLFDFADIESWDPAGKRYPDTDDSCGWCGDWCDSHPQDCVGLTDECAHSHPLNCNLKAQAFWWMMARLSGWDGNPKTAETATSSQTTIQATTVTTVSMMATSSTTAKVNSFTSSTLKTTTTSLDEQAPTGSNGSGNIEPGLLERIFLFFRKILNF